MNVLITANYTSSYSGNFVNSLLELADCGKQRGINIYFYFPLKADGSKCEWIDYIKLRGYTVELYDSMLDENIIVSKLLRVIDMYQIELIHTHFNSLNNILLWNKSVKEKVKICFHDHMDYDADKKVFPQIIKQIKVSKRYKEYGIGVISVMKKKNKAYWLVPKRWYIPNGISFQRNVDRILTRQEYRDKIGLKNNQILCLFLGWDMYRKGLDIAIKSVLECRKENPNIVLGIMGFGEKPSQEVLSQIERLVGIQPIQEGIKFLEFEEDMFSVHRGADIYLSASRTEAFAYGILEAISQDTPVVVSDINGTKWCWKYSKAVRFRKNSVSDCSKALLKALDLGNNISNSKQIIEEYCIDKWSKKVLDVYEQMLH